MFAEAPPQHPLQAIASPRREIWLGSVAVAVFFGGFVAWSAFAPLDSAAHASGQVTVSGSRQLVQHLDGGTISALLVKEGDVVAAGQPLVELNAAEVRATERSVATRVIQRQAQLARIRAETLGQIFVPPASFAGLSGEDRVLADDAVTMAERELAARVAGYATEQAVLRQRIDQLNEQITGGQAQVAANQRQQGFVSDELKGMQRLADQGFAAQTRVRALQRSAAELEGAHGSEHGEIARLNAGVGEIRLQITQTSVERAKALAEESRTAETELAALLPQWEAARQKLASARVTSPVAGTVMAMRVHTVGGVVAAGQSLMEIVPLRPTLSMDVHIAPRDVQSLHAGQDVEVKFPGIGNRRTPILHGVLATLSPDALIEERTGVAYYTGSVTVRDAELAKLDGGGKVADLRPGMPVEVLIRKRKRSLLAFLFEPLASTFWSQGG